MGLQTVVSLSNKTITEALSTSTLKTWESDLNEKVLHNNNNDVKNTRKMFLTHDHKYQCPDYQDDHVFYPHQVTCE